MALNVGTLPVSAVYLGSAEVKQVYVGADLVWENRETVTITGTSGTQVRDSFRAALTARGLDYKTVVTVPFLLDTSQVTSMSGMFNGCAALTSVPDMNTSNVTDMRYMFENCAALTSVPVMNTSQVTNMGGMFRNCAALTSVPDMDTSQVTMMNYMFENCAALTDGNVRCIGKKSGVYTSSMIYNSGLTKLPFYDANGNWTG